MVTPSAFASGDDLDAMVKSVQGQCTSPMKMDTERYTYSVEPSDASPRQVYAVVAVFCDLAAYNAANVWIIGDTYGEISILAFPEPTFDVDYEDENADLQVVKSVNITGYSAVTRLSNSDFDPKTGVFSSYHKWRGMGDAASGGTWKLVNGQAQLVDYFVDASFDGEINPQTIVSFK